MNIKDIKLDPLLSSVLNTWNPKDLQTSSPDPHSRAAKSERPAAGVVSCSKKEEVTQVLILDHGSVSRNARHSRVVTGSPV